MWSVSRRHAEKTGSGLTALPPASLPVARIWYHCCVPAGRPLSTYSVVLALSVRSASRVPSGGSLVSTWMVANAVPFHLWRTNPGDGITVGRGHVPSELDRHSCLWVSPSASGLRCHLRGRGIGEDSRPVTWTMARSLRVRCSNASCQPQGPYPCKSGRRESEPSTAGSLSFVDPAAAVPLVDLVLGDRPSHRRSHGASHQDCDPELEVAVVGVTLSSRRAPDRRPGSWAHRRAFRRVLP